MYTIIKEEGRKTGIRNHKEEVTEETGRMTIQ